MKEKEKMETKETKRIRELRIRIAVADDKNVMAIESSGFDKTKMEDLLLMVGVFENLKQTVLEKIKTMDRRSMVI